MTRRVVEVQGDRSVAWRPVRAYPLIGLSVAAVAAVLVMADVMPAEDGVGLGVAAVLISLLIASILSLIWLATGCRVSYTVTVDEVLARRGSRIQARYPTGRIEDAGFVDMLGWEGMLFSYPWPEFPYLWLKLRVASDEIKEVRLPGIAIWGRDQVSTVERDVRSCLGLKNE